MSEANIETARRIFAAVAVRDVETLVELTDPDVEWRSFFAFGEAGGEYRGHDGLRRYVDDLADAWEVIRPEIDGAIAAGDVVVIVGRIAYEGRESGTAAKDRAGWICRFRDGRLGEFWAFRDPERMLAAAITNVPR